MNPLILHLKAKHYWKIKKGEKTSDYREDKPYWRSRIHGQKEVILVLGYASDNCWDLKGDIKDISMVHFDDLPEHAKIEFYFSDYNKFFKIDFELANVRNTKEKAK